MQILKIIVTKNYEKDIQRIRKRNLSLFELDKIIKILQKQEILPIKYKNHILLGKYKTYSECHIKPDWLLIYKVVDNSLYLYRTGTHSDLF
jgi:mRNA interferase YafQ